MVRISVLPKFSDHTPLLQTDQTVPLSLLQDYSLTRLKRDQLPFFIRGTAYNTYRTLNHAPSLRTAMVVLPA